MDAHATNWYIQNAEIFFPNLKKILIDDKDEDLFRAIDNAQGDKIVVLVN